MKGVPGSYDSSHVHGKPGNEHVDIYFRGDKGEVESKSHVSLSEWIWSKVTGGESEGGSKEKPTLRG